MASRSAQRLAGLLASALGAALLNWLTLDAVGTSVPQPIQAMQVPGHVLLPAAVAVVDMEALAATDEARQRTLRQLGIRPIGVRPNEGEHSEPQFPGLTPLLVGPRDLAPLSGVASPTPTLSYQGLDDISDGTFSYIPPDTTGAVGPTRLFNTLNNNYRIITKATGAVVSTVAQNAFWHAVNPSDGVFDPQITFDPYQNRFIVAAAASAQSTSSSLLVGVSNSSDPGGTWTLARYPMGSTNCTGGISCWADYPTLGFNQTWIAVGLNMFRVSNNQSVESRLTTFNYSTFVSGSAPVINYFVTTDFTIRPVTTYSNSETTLYAPTHVSSSGASYRLNTITGTADSPTYTQGTLKTHTLLSGWAAPGGDTLPQAPEPATSLVQGVDAGDARLINAVFRNNAVWYAQTIGLPKTGPLTHTAAQWVKIDTSGNDLDAGRVEDATATSTNGGKWYAYPSISVNANNDALLGFSQFSSAQFPSAGYAFRAGTDAAGTMRDPAVSKSGIGFYFKTYGGGANRWGDFSFTQVDPSDDTALWSVQEYSKAQSGTGDGSGFWSTWWVQITPPVATSYSLTISKAGSGAGTVTSNPAGINCGATCSASFSSGTSVALTATPSAGSTFAGWTGDADCSDGNVTMSTAVNCTATFTQMYTLTISKAGTGSGTVTSNPAGINCGATCSASFASGTGVALTASPAAGSTFAGWTGDADCSDGNVTMSAARSCTATFTQMYTLTISKAGSGSGTVTSNPAGINCGATCSASFASGTGVALTASPTAGSTFAGWTGDADCSDGNVTMSSAVNCTATFTPAYTLTISKAGTGSGTVTSNPAGINCGATCSAGFTSGTSVALTASPSVGSTFAGWTGDADCSDGNVTMSAARSCTATFTAQLPAPFSKIGPLSGAMSPPAMQTLSWASSSPVDHYEYCLDTVNDNACNTAWTSTSNRTSVMAGLNPNTTYFWQVRAVNSAGTTTADGGTWWTFTSGPPVSVPHVNRSDFTGDGQPDIIWQEPSTGAVLLWQMSGPNYVSSTVLNSGGTYWKVVGTGDFTGDGKADLLWQHPATGAVLLWVMDGTAVVDGIMLNSGGTAWRVAAVGDFTGDGKLDIVWQYPTTGAVLLWQMDGTTLVGGDILNDGSTLWQVVGACDLTGDGKDDLLWQHPYTGAVLVWQMNGPTYVSSTIVNAGGTFWQIVANGDFTGDGKIDLLWQHPSTGAVLLWSMDGTTYTGSTIVNPGGTYWKIKGPR